jgi:Tfp pilus assembly protein PilZ
VADLVNQRKCPRVKTDIPVKTKRAQRVMFEAKVLNLSEGGAFLETNQKLAKGEDLILFVGLEIKGKEKSCVLQGKVAWSNSERTKGAIGCGVAFHGISASMARTLRDFVGQKSPEPVSAVGVAEDPKGPKAPTRGQLRG